MTKTATGVGDGTSAKTATGVGNGTSAKTATGVGNGTSAGGLSLSYVNEIMLAAYAVSKLQSGVTCHIRRRDKPIKLSRQQRQMVSLLEQGYRGTTIAELTGLSLSTVKSHLAAAYRKLEVTNAMDAVIKARDLKLIDGQDTPAIHENSCYSRVQKGEEE